MRSKRTKPRPGRLKGPELEALRHECWLRDKGVCRRCAIDTIENAPHTWENSYHMSHIRNKRMWGDSLSNVEVLCGACHRDHHLGTKNARMFSNDNDIAVQAAHRKYYPFN